MGDEVRGGGKGTTHLSLYLSQPPNLLAFSCSVHIEFLQPSSPFRDFLDPKRKSGDGKDGK